jgi:hypothetical protein
MNSSAASVITLLKFRHHDLHSDKIFAIEENLYFHKTQYLKHKLGLSG